MVGWWVGGREWVGKVRGSLPGCKNNEWEFVIIWAQGEPSGAMREREAPFWNPSLVAAAARGLQVLVGTVRTWLKVDNGLCFAPGLSRGDDTGSRRGREGSLSRIELRGQRGVRCRAGAQSWQPRRALLPCCGTKEHVKTNQVGRVTVTAVGELARWLWGCRSVARAVRARQKMKSCTPLVFQQVWTQKRLVEKVKRRPDGYQEWGALTAARC